MNTIKPEELMRRLDMAVAARDVATITRQVQRDWKATARFAIDTKRRSKTARRARPKINAALVRGTAARSSCAYSLPDIAEFRQKMQTDEAKAIYKTRSQVAEFPNLWIKTKFGLRQFSVRGVAKVRIESEWAALTYNICQWIRLRWGPKLESKLLPA